MVLEKNADDFDIEERVSFRIEDVFHPGHEEILNGMMPGFRFRGKIQYFSATGDGKQRYAVIETEGLTHPLLVSVMNLKTEERDSE